ncbi:MAG: ferredoxin [Pseudonocardia sp. SCN 72-86]|nr:MAG: ferredoxin [Pseudonocardia sp. SCN 72-86]
MKVTVDGSLCTGHGRCYSLAPDIFEPDDEGYSMQRDVPIPIPPGQEELTRRATHACPEGAITAIEG